MRLRTLLRGMASRLRRNFPLEGEAAEAPPERSRRSFLGLLAGGAAAGVAAVGVAAATRAGAAAELLDGEGAGSAALKFQEFFKGNYQVMTAAERQATVARLERLAAIEHNQTIEVSAQEARPNVLFGYAFNVSKCKGYQDCVRACVNENNQDRASNMQYIKIFETKTGNLGLAGARADRYEEVPEEGSFYLGTQCFQCENPPCTKVCPVGATWREPDGIVVIDYDWCVGCRYCIAACPYWARRFNWHSPNVPEAELNPVQHYLGNRPRKRGVVEKCTFCIQRTRQGLLPACVEACPTGARVFGNLLDPDSEIRWVLENKRVFRLKEDLGAEPKFWYFMD